MSGDVGSRGHDAKTTASAAAAAEKRQDVGGTPSVAHLGQGPSGDTSYYFVT